MPWRIEDEMNRLGANYVQGGMWHGFAYATETSSPGSKTFQGLKPQSLSSGRSVSDEVFPQRQTDD